MDTLTRRTLHVDAAANTLAGLALLAAGGWLAPHVGLAAAWPLRVAGAVLVVYGLENALLARRPSRTGLAALIGVDAGFAVAALTFVVLDPTGAAGWVRALLAVTALASLGVGALKQRGRGRLEVPDVAAPPLPSR